MHTPQLETRRDALVRAIGLAAAGGLLAQGYRADAAAGPANDWAWLAGSWKVRHRRLKSRLTGSSDWQEFDGSCVNWPLMGGAANVDDNVIKLPAGDYHGVSLRRFNPETRKWGIWWIDSRYAQIEPPVWGEFRNGVGTFLGEGMHESTPVTVRYRWSAITATSAHWEQAFSTDGGKRWESNWHMDFTRVAA